MTIVLPTSPIEGNDYTITAGDFGVTTLTINPVGPASATFVTGSNITTLAAGNSVSFCYRTATNKWYKTSATSSISSVVTSLVSITRFILNEETTATGGETSITFTHTPTGTVLLHIDGVRLRQGEDFTISGSTATLVGITLSVGQSIGRSYAWADSVDVGESAIISLSQSRAKTATMTYSGNILQSIAYSSGDGFTSHTRTLGYTGLDLTTVTEVFTYGGEVWTLTKTLVYSGGNPSTVTNTLTRI